MNKPEESTERFPTVIIEAIEPCIDGGRYPVKRVIGQELRVSADIFKDGHDVLAAVLKWRVLGSTAWLETPMIPGDNDRWSAVCHFTENATYEFTIEGWGDEFNSWAVEFQKKFAAGITDLAMPVNQPSVPK